MTTVVLVQAFPRNALTGAEVAVRLAGCGTRPYFQLGYNDWRAGMTRPPRFAAALAFGQGGFTGGALPQTGGLRFFPSDKDLLSTLANLNWDRARIVVTTGDDEDPVPTYATAFIGQVTSAGAADGAMAFTLGDLSVDLAKPVCPDTFVGTGDLEGGDEATGRVKRRTWGYAFNIEGQVLDKAYGVYEFGDPNRPLNAFPMVKDKGREYGSYVDVAWQGSTAATLAALRTAVVPDSGVARAPSIAACKPWTTPAGPITADIWGEVGSGYVDTAPAIAARIVSVYSTEIVVGNTGEALGWQSAQAGVHCGDASETVGDVLDRLLLPVSTGWFLGGDGVFVFRHLHWGDPVETLVAETIEREETFAPLRTRRVGFQRNYRQHSDAEISATLLLATDATYLDGTTLEDFKPAEGGADVTATRQHTVPAVPDCHVNADYTGATASGQLPQSRFIQHLVGSTDVSTMSNVTASATGGVAITVNNTPDDEQRGLVTINAGQNVPSLATISGVSSQGGVDVPFQFQIIRDDAPPPTSGGGTGGGGGAASSAASSPVTTAPGRGSNVEMARTAAVTTGPQETVALTCPITYYDVNEGSFNDEDDVMGAQLQARLEYSTNGGASWLAAGAALTGEPAKAWFKFSQPGKGQKDSPASVNLSATITGLVAGTSVVARVMGSAVLGNVATVEGTLVANPS